MRGRRRALSHTLILRRLPDRHGRRGRRARRHRHRTIAAQLLLLLRCLRRRTQYQRALVMISLALLKLQGQRIAVTRLASVVRARAVLLLAGAVAL